MIVNSLRIVQGVALRWSELVITRHMTVVSRNKELERKTVISLEGPEKEVSTFQKVISLVSMSELLIELCMPCAA